MSIRHNPALDGMRAIAVFSVMAYHSSVPYFGNGLLGVDVFFVLSGYLITSILLREIETGGIQLGAFYVRRIRRLYPALTALVLVLMAIKWASWQDGVHTLLYMTDYVKPPDMLAHTWSLSVEEHYYLLWPLVLPFVVRLKRPVLILMCVYLAASAWTAFGGDVFPWRHSFRFDARLTGLIFGSMLAFLPTDSKLPAVVAAIAFVLLMLGLPEQRPLTECLTGFFILLSHRTTLPYVTRPTFVFIGRISYGLYLYHIPIEWISRGWYDMDTTRRFSITLSGSLFFAILSYYTIETYFRRPKTVPLAVQPA